MQPRDILVANHEGFTAYVPEKLSEDPLKIVVCSLEDPNKSIIEFNTDAIDSMGFLSNVDKLKTLPVQQQQAAIHCLGAALKNKFGGKNILKVAPEFVAMFSEAGFSTHPVFPNGKAFRRFMYIDRKTLKEGLNTLKVTAQQKHVLLRTELDMNRKLLTARAEDISFLLMQNAEYARLKNKRLAYSADAIKKRINDKNIHSFALRNNESEKTIAFMRVYIDEDTGVAYASDLVVRDKNQRQALATVLMQFAFDLLKDKADTLFIIAGDELAKGKENDPEERAKAKEWLFYTEKLGFKSVHDQATNENKPVTLSDGSVVMFGLFPPQRLLNDLTKNHTIPDHPFLKTLDWNSEIFYRFDRTNTWSPVTQVAAEGPDQGDEVTQLNVSTQSPEKTEQLSQYLSLYGFNNRVSHPVLDKAVVTVDLTRSNPRIKI
jgi:hypothetical protein